MTNTSIYDLLSSHERETVRRAIAQSAHVLPIAPQALQEKSRVLDFKLKRHIQPTLAPRGKRDIADVASLIQSCVRRIHEAESACPSAGDYQAALNAEHEAYRLWQFMKASKRRDADGTWSMSVSRQKHVYEETKYRRIQVGGAIIGAQSIVRRMGLMIAGELKTLGLLREVA